MKKHIAILAGDGIGPEVMAQAQRVLNQIALKFNHDFIYHEALIGGAAYDQFGEHFPDTTHHIAERADAILFGSVGGPVAEQNLPKWNGCEAKSLLALRQAFQFNINIRPAILYPSLTSICPLKPEIIGDGINIVVFRELLGDLYFGSHLQTILNGRRHAEDQALYNEDQIASIAHAAFKSAKTRRKKVTSVDKANVLATSKLWRTVVTEVSKEYPEVALEHMLVDNCAMQLILRPTQFDVILSTNMFGDILSDAAAVLPGSLGLMPSASLNSKGFGMFEPSGGSAQDIAGKNIANPIAQILSAAMMLRHAFSMEIESKAIETAVEEALKEGARTRDIASDAKIALSTSALTDVILHYLL